MYKKLAFAGNKKNKKNTFRFVGVLLCANSNNNLPTTMLAVILVYICTLHHIYGFESFISNPLTLGKSYRPANWSTFEVMKGGNVTDSIELTNKLKLYHYWDPLKGSFKTSVRGEDMAVMYPELIQSVTKKITHAGNSSEMEHIIVDTNSLFMHMLLTIQYLAERSDEMLWMLKELKEAQQSHSLTVQLPENTTSFADRELETQILKLEQSIVDLRVQTIHTHLNYSMQLIDELYANKTTALLETHNSTLAAVENHYHNTTLISTQKRDALFKIIEEQAALDYLKANQELRIEKNMSLYSLKVETEQKLLLLDYRIQEELKLQDELQKIQLEKTKVQSEQYRQSTEQVIQAVAEEISLIFLSIFSDMQLLAIYVRNFLIVFVILIGTIELSSSLQLIVSKHLIQKSKLYSKQFDTATWSNYFQSKILGKKVYMMTNGGTGTEGQPREEQSVDTRKAMAATTATAVPAVNSGGGRLRNKRKGNVPSTTSSSVSTPVPSPTISTTSSIATTNTIPNNYHAGATLSPYYHHIQTCFQMSHFIYPLGIQSLLYSYFYELSIAIDHSAPLPNALFYGPPGCGKSICGQMMIHYVHDHFHMNTMILSGADLIALGKDANHYIHELFRTYQGSMNAQSMRPGYAQHHRVSSQRLLLVIDEADILIRARSTLAQTLHQTAAAAASTIAASAVMATPHHKNASYEQELSPEHGHQPQHHYNLRSTHTHTQEEDIIAAEEEAAFVLATAQSNHAAASRTNHILFALLENLRQSNPNVAVLFTTRLSMDQIDHAILDRLDSVLPFPLPQLNERLTYALGNFLPMFQDFLTTSDIQSVQQFLANEHKRQEHLIQDCQGGYPYNLARLFDQLGLSKEQWSVYQSPEMDHQPNELALSISTDRFTAHLHTMNYRRHVVHKKKQSTTKHVGGGQEDMSVASAMGAQGESHHPTEQATKHIQSFIMQQLPNFSKNSFEVVMCMKALMVLSIHWSYRDLHKKFTNIRYAVISSEKCALNTQVWMRELCYEDL